MNDAARDRIDALFRTRPRDRFLRWSSAALLLLLAGSWIAGDFGLSDAFSERRLANLERFVAEVRPFPTRDAPFSFDAAVGWARDLLAERGVEAALATLSISVVAIVIAALLAFPFAVVGARNLMTPEPFAAGGRPAGRARRLSFRLAVLLSRGTLTLLRSVPEYVLAFLLVAMLGQSAWPAVLALAIHNTGILGRLQSETLENVSTSVPTTLRALGSGRRQIVFAGLVPVVLPRFLLYFFYRWETCVREATVLGMLGVVSLGYWIDDARVRGKHDEFLFFVLLGAVIVLAGDLASAVCRGIVRRAS